MKKIIVPSLAVAAALVAGPMAYAGETGGVAVELKAGTLGGGVEVNYAVSPKFTVGLGLNKFTRSFSDTTDGIDYDVDMNLQSLALLASFHPFEGAFRLTAGAMSNGNELEMKAKLNPSQTYDIGDTTGTYTGDDIGTLSGKVDFNAVAPYFGLGWGKSPEKGFGLTLDIGVLFQGAPKVDFTSTGGTLSNDANFQAELKKEEANAEDDIKGFTAYPVMSLGLNYRF
jgi:hypothetical protein